MGLGLLAAGGLAGLGQAGMAASSMVLKSELDRDEKEWLLQRQEAMQISREGREQTAKIGDETRKLDYAEQERGRLGKIYTNSTAGPGVAEGPPNEDGSMPKGNMSDKQKTAAYIDALKNSGDIEAAAKFEQLSSRGDVEALRSEMKLLDMQRKADYGNALLDLKRDNLSRQQQHTDWQTSGQPGGSRGGGGGSALGQERFNESKLSKHISEQSQYYKFPKSSGDGYDDLIPAKSTYSSLVRKIGPDQADSVMSAAKEEAEKSAINADGTLDQDKFRSSYLRTMESINKRVTGRAPDAAPPTEKPTGLLQTAPPAESKPIVSELKPLDYGFNPDKFDLVYEAAKKGGVQHKQQLKYWIESNDLTRSQIQRAQNALK